MQRTISTETIRKLSTNQRDLLIAHINGPFELSLSTRHLSAARNALLNSKLIFGWPLGTPKPRKTALSDAGRQAVCAILGEAADALVRAGLLEQGDPLAALRRLQGLRRAGPGDIVAFTEQ